MDKKCETVFLPAEWVRGLLLGDRQHHSAIRELIDNQSAQPAGEAVNVEPAGIVDDDGVAWAYGVTGGKFKSGTLLYTRPAPDARLVDGLGDIDFEPRTAPEAYLQQEYQKLQSIARRAINLAKCIENPERIIGKAFDLEREMLAAAGKE